MNARAIGLFAAPLLAGSLSLYGASYWAGPGGTVDETVADSPPPASSLEPAANQIPSAEFRYPAVDELENITFIVDPPNSHGIYRSDPLNRRLTELVTSKVTSLPGSGATVDFIRGLVTNGTDFVFNATDSQHGRGLYFWRDGRLRAIARTGDPVAPGSSARFVRIEYGALLGDSVLFSAKADDGGSLLLRDVETGSSRTLVHTGMPVPGRPEAKFDTIAPVNWIDENDLVFRASAVPPPAGGDGPASPLGIYGWFGCGPGYPLRDLRTIADGATPIPGLDGRRFTNFHSAPVQNGLVAFVGDGRGSKGVYFSDANAKEKAPRVIVDTETRLPSLFQGTFQDFGWYPSLVGGCVIFTARAGHGYAGVFLYNPGIDKLFRLVDSHQAIGGKTPSGFAIAGEVMVRNRFAIAATFPDGTTGVYLATIPAEGFTRMGAPGL